MFIFQQLANVSWSYLVRTGVECCDSDQESENDYESIPEQRGFAIPSVPPVLTQPEALPNTFECVPILISEPAFPPGSPPLTPANGPPVLPPRASTRPERSRKPPTYLSDYVT